MTKLMAHNLRVALIASLILLAGWCLGGRIGLGVGSIIVLLIQLL